MSEDQILRSLDQANLNVLRLALYQMTGDPVLADMKVEKKPIRGGAFFASVLADEHADEVKRRAFEFLTGHPVVVPPPPSETESRRLMELLTGTPLSDDQFRFGYEELGFADFPRSAEWTNRPSDEALAQLHVVVIGAGISGIAVAVNLERLGIPYTVIERQSGIGGTWLLNTYPEARVDTSSYFYQFRFEKNYPWTEYFASQQETRRYLEHVAVKHGVAPHIRFNVEVFSAQWNEIDAEWELLLRGPNGETESTRSTTVISAAGMFAKAKIPDIEGIDSFAGEICHTAEWNHNLDVTGQRVALIGNGSTGVQLMPYLAERAASLTVFQRTPNWISPIDGYRDVVTPEVRWLFDNVPYYWNWYGYVQMAASVGLQAGQAHDREWQRAGGQISEANDRLRATITEYIRSKVGYDPELYAKCVPAYAPLGRRLVVDNGWYDALRRDNVELVTDRIERFTPKGIVTAEGAERQLDLVVLAAGFDVERYFWPVEYRGRDGLTLEQAWSKDGARAYLGLTVPGFPNLFTLFGPNSLPRAGSFYTWAEMWSRYVAKAIVGMVESGARSMDIRTEVSEAYNVRMDEALKGLIWLEETAGSYYVNAYGRITGRMPWLVEEYYQWVREPNLEDFTLR